MQHLNYYTLSLLLPYLEEAYLGRKIESVWSQEKDTLMIQFSDSSLPFLMISCQPQFPFILPIKEYRKRKSNVALLFQSLLGEVVNQIQLPFQERCLIFYLSSHILCVKLFGVHANVIQFQDDDSYPVEIFRKNLKKDYQMTLKNFFVPKELPSILPKDKLRDWLPAIEADWLHLFPNDTYTLQEIEAILSQNILPPPYYIYEQERIPYFSLIPLQSFPLLFQSNSILECLQSFIFKFLSVKKRLQRLNQIGMELKRYKTFLAKSLQRSEKRIQSMVQQRSPKELADILLTHLHLLKPGMESITLPDLYRPGQYVTIQLNAQLSPMENIQHYYQKEKHIQFSLERMKKSYENYLRQRSEVEKAWNEYKAIKTDKELRYFLKRYKDLFQLISSTGSKTRDSISIPRLDIEGYQIFYGRSARENEYLMQKVAKKEDWWFHVKGGTGAHVIVKAPNRGKLPEKIKEIAGGIAAFLSKNSNQSLVLVQYTKRKYLRKGKGLPPGTFLVEREETFLVPPYKVP